MRTAAAAIVLALVLGGCAQGQVRSAARTSTTVTTAAPVSMQEAALCDAAVQVLDGIHQAGGTVNIWDGVRPLRLAANEAKGVTLNRDVADAANVVIDRVDRMQELALDSTGIDRQLALDENRLNAERGSSYRVPVPEVPTEAELSESARLVAVGLARLVEACTRARSG